MNLVQFEGDDGACHVGVVADAGRRLQVLTDTVSTYGLAADAIVAGQPVAELVQSRAGSLTVDYDALAGEGRLLPPIDHPDAAHCLVTGTGLSHLGSAEARHKMHTIAEDDAANLTDSMKMFRMGLEGGKPPAGEIGVQPEWFYKGDGSCLATPGQALEMPAFALDGSEEPEIAGIYVIAPDGTPCRLGFAIGNEFSDHVMEKQNYLLLAHSKLRSCAVGPELKLGPLPDDVRGTSRIWRGNEIIFEREFLSGEANMSHTIANLEQHHFKYAMFRRPGDVHIHFFGTATLSYTEGISTRLGDVFEIEADEFGRALRNPLGRREAETIEVRPL